MKLKPKTIQIPKRIADKYQWNGTEKFLQDGLVDGGEESAYEIGGKQALLLLSQDNEILPQRKWNLTLIHMVNFQSTSLFMTMATYCPEEDRILNSKAI